MKDTMEQRLAADLREVGTATRVPPPPLGELVRAGKRRVRRNRVLTAAAGVAAVCVVMVGVTLGPGLVSAHKTVQPVHPGPAKVHQTTGEIRSLEDLPQGAAPRVPYWHDGVLHTAGATLPTQLRAIITGGSTTLVGSGRFDGVSQWWMVVGTELVPVAKATHLMPPLVSTDGRLVVWEEIEPTRTTLTAWDVAARRVLATRQVTVAQSCCDGPSLLLYGADSSGHVFYDAGRGLAVWDPATDATRTVSGLDGLAPGPSQVTASGPVFQGTGRWDSLEGIYGSVDEGAAFHRAGTVPTDQGGTWSPDGTLFAYPGDDNGDYAAKASPTTQVVLEVATGRTRRMHLPSGITGDVMWESPETLLVHTVSGPDQHDVIRCDATTGACQMALRVGSLHGWSFPQHF